MTIRLDDLQSNPAARPRARRKGRGIAAGQGASCGFGMRGQKSRSGRPTRPGFEGGQMPLYRRIPKLKHFTQVTPNTYTVVNIAALAGLEPGTDVTPSSLEAMGIITSPRHDRLKVLGSGELQANLHVRAHAFTASARQKIEAAGGTCELLPGRNKWVRQRS
ncbi:MAG: 50S ribosomal protein L15 [Aphanocapsa feldmannii 277cV]|uniref:Large ribosomal subunit protein uL15 n=2 Tax=Aphanocapsa feldmannii TaxID=192050 RepID=A0A524RMU1_9CHRO|nr:MAG: 50S ribosomal protein L15 [Aphanocapsa feldmannii 288cV]TGG91927.1 MAG: 50S ribosomal protein L15 [Aphanocapsa feldmannii 277cV]TGH28110.1 MAG: 50S ribosomal protein L15 [Aphanocapsa feldmannii 277cI]